MAERAVSRGVMKKINVYGMWLVLAVLGILTALQLHGTLVFVGLRLVELPIVNRFGWNTATIHGLSRFLYLVAGVLWLFFVTYLERYLSKAAEHGVFWRRCLQITAGLGALYGLCYLVLLLLG